MSRRRFGLQSLALLALAGVMSACANKTSATAAVPAASASLWGSEWALQDLGGQAALAQPQASLSFAKAGQVSGFGSCNQFFGTAEVNQDRIKVGPLGSTKIACSGAVGAQESRYMAALQKAQRYELMGDTLLIHAEGMAQPLRFVRSAARK